MVFSEHYQEKDQRQNRATPHNIRYYVMWIVYLLTAVTLPFVGIPIGIMLKDDEDKRARSIIIIGSIASVLILVWMVTGVISYIRTEGGMPIL